MQTAEDVYSTGGAARTLGVSSTYVRRLISQGRLTARPTPIGYLIDAPELERFQRTRRAGRASSIQP